MKDDTISRQAAIDALENIDCSDGIGISTLKCDVVEDALNAIKALPSAQPEIKPIEYRDCANAMLKMWMDNVVTDGEYNRIMDKLNVHWGMENERFNQPSGGDNPIVAQ